MKLILSYKEQNPDFNKSYSDEYHNGEESDGNRKINWSTSYKILNVSEIKVVDCDYNVDLRNEKGQVIDVCFPNMKILECYFDGELRYKYAVSNTLLKGFHNVYDSKYDICRFYFYFLPEMNFLKLFNCIYVAVNEIPEQLLEIKKND